MILCRPGFSSSKIKGYEHTEPSHTAVAQAVAAGQADVGLGIEAAARARGLDFVPLVEEDYHLVCLKSALDEPAVQALCRVLQSDDWQEVLHQLPGYRMADAAGQVLSLRRTLPWWNYRTEKTPSGAKPEPAPQRAQERKPQKMSSRPGK
jgi:putative molybdopterin biosynthesis protein